MAEEPGSQPTRIGIYALVSSSEPEPEALGLPPESVEAVVVTETTEPFASVTVVVTEPSALVALEVVSADEDEEDEDDGADGAALGVLAGCGALTAAGISVMELMVISLPLSLTKATVAPTDEAMINTPGLTG